MDITFDLLERILAPIEDLGRDEVTIPVGDTTVTLKVILPEQENESQRAASASGVASESEEKEDTSEVAGVTKMVDYIQRLEVEVLSRAIVAVGDTDFRAVKYVETDETLGDGQKVRIPLHAALKKFVLRWAGPVRTRIYQNYHELLTQVERKAEERIKYDPSDVTTELERAKARVTRLEKELERRKNPSLSSVVGSQIHAIAQGELTRESEPEEESKPPTPEPVTPPAGRPVMAPPPVQRVTPQTPKPVVAQPHDDLGDVEDSFASPDDMGAAVEAENRRLLVDRRRIEAGLPPMASSVSSGIDHLREVYGHRRPPHAGAAEAAAEVFTEPDLPTEPPVTGQVEVLTRRQERPPTHVQVDGPAKGSRNPRFNPPKRVP